MREDLKKERKKFHFFQLRWKEPLGDKKCPYAYRWVLNLGLFAIRLHKWLRSDDKRYFHNHPYWFFTLILWGGYTDVTPNGREELGFLSFRFRKANHTHYVEVPKNGCLSLLITGPVIQPWGFLVNGKLKRPFKYFHKFGHPPCDEQ